MTSDYNRRITEVERNSMDSAILNYLTRHVISCGQIENYDAMRDLYLASMPAHIVPVWHSMDTWYKLRQRRPPALDQQCAAGMPVRFPSGKVLLLQYPMHLANARCEPMPDIDMEPMEVVNAAVLGNDEVVADLEAWCVKACEVASRVHRSFNTATEITAICNTVGQLHRVCPDLVRYVFPQTAEALRNQVRRSPVPDGWMEIDRSRIADMCNHLALCYLLPECPPLKGDYRSYLDTACWAFDQTTRKFASWPAHRALEAKRLHR